MYSILRSKTLELRKKWAMKGMVHEYNSQLILVSVLRTVRRETP